jgi:uncharacterized protein YdeI (YjbR/CyaY-like superfamily)
MNDLNPKVDAFIGRATQWQAEYIKMRQIVMDCGLTEDLKWGVPCYTVNGKNVIIIHGFKEYCAFLFIKGALMQDLKGIFIQQTENVQAARHVRFTSVDEIEELTPTLKAYILEAVEVEKSDLKVEFKKTTDFPMAEEFKARLDEDPALQSAFNALTPGRQRAYLLFFSTPKQSQTRAARVEKSIPQILAGKGLND